MPFVDLLSAEKLRARARATKQQFSNFAINQPSPNAAVITSKSCLTPNQRQNKAHAIRRIASGDGAAHFRHVSFGDVQALPSIASMGRTAGLCVCARYAVLKNFVDQRIVNGGADIGDGDGSLCFGRG